MSDTRVANAECCKHRKTRLGRQPRPPRLHHFHLLSHTPFPRAAAAVLTVMSSVHAAGSATETQTQTLDATLDQVEQPTPSSTAAPDETFGDGTAGPSSAPLCNNGRVSGVEKADTAAEPTIGPGALQPGEGVVALSEVEHVEGVEVDREQSSVIESDESGQWTEDESHELKRVKVYELIGSRWVDQGTAFCFGDFQDNGALLIARAEADFNHVILSTTIRTNDVYQRQQGEFGQYPSLWWC